MKINIVKNFPIFKTGDIVKVDPKEQGGAKIGKVIATWYPEKGDSWNERAECENLGYLRSNYEKPFPQLVVEVITPAKKRKSETHTGLLRINPTEFIEKIL